METKNKIFFIRLDFPKPLSCIYPSCMRSWTQRRYLLKNKISHHLHMTVDVRLVPMFGNILQRVRFAEKKWRLPIAAVSKTVASICFEHDGFRSTPSIKKYKMF